METTLQEQAFLFAMHSAPSIGQEKLSRLIQHFPTAQEMWNARGDDLIEANISASDVAAIHKHQTDLQKSQMTPDLLWKPYAQQGISILSITDKNYPQKIAQCGNAPALIYYRGNIAIANEHSVAVVGSRKFTTYGKQAATRLSYDLSTYGIHIVSGLALGIDGIAHNAALEAYAQSATNGSTIAILGGGIDNTTIAPKAHYNLAQNILENNGLIMSTFAPGTQPSKGTFPARNKLMVMISDATLIIEAAESSGTLITAQIAQTSNKKLFAIPGSIFAPSGVGSNAIIASGKAKLIQSAQDIADNLGLSRSSQTASTRTYTPSNTIEASILKTLQKYPNGVFIDKIVRDTTLEGASVSSSLVILEIDGIVIHLGGGQYALK